MLILDALINFILGFLLLAFPLELFQFLGLPIETPPFYANILGAVLVGIGIALLTEYFRGSGRTVGLGLGGAIIINLYGALVLAILLVSGKLGIPLHGRVTLWALIVLLLAVSGLELYLLLRKKGAKTNVHESHQRLC